VYYENLFSDSQNPSVVVTLEILKVATREGAKGVEAPPLSKSKLRKKNIG